MSAPVPIANALSIAGVDPSGGAGVFADLKAFAARGVYGCAVVAALTAQNTRTVSAIHIPPAAFLRQQIDTLLADIRIDAIKIGMLGSAASIETIATALAHWQAGPIVLDPVMQAKSGDRLLQRSAQHALIEALLPQAHIITPNLPEAALLLGERAATNQREMIQSAEKLRRLLPASDTRWVLLKGGHLDSAECTDLLFDGDQLHKFSAPRVATKNTHGTGCSLSAALAAELAKGHRVPDALRHAHRWLQGALQHADALDVGHGHGPLHHFHALWPHP